MAIGIYVHIPFCKQKCLYCDFNSYAGMETKVSAYCDALVKEINLFGGDKDADTLYFGGGTPTYLPVENLVLILNAIRNKFNVLDDAEITIECNPGTIDKEGLVKLRKAGFNRMSIGLQSADDTLLKNLGRIHSFAEFCECVNSAREAGFENLSFDLMYGLPEQSMDIWKETLDKAIILNPDHISCYGLKVEEGTPFSRMNINLPDEDITCEMYDYLVEYLKKFDYSRYEISNFAKQGRESRHNTRYWLCNDFIGFGAGAYSCVNNKRFSNCLSVNDYCEMIENDKTAVVNEEILTYNDLMSEFCFLGLRLKEGISEMEFQNRFNRDIQSVFGDVLEKNLKRGTLTYKNNRFLIPDEFIYVSNSIMCDFIL